MIHNFSMDNTTGSNSEAGTPYLYGELDAIYPVYNWGRVVQSLVF